MSYAFLGVRACDLRAIRILDQVMIGGRFQDPAYGSRRVGAFLIAVECTEPGATCFCVSMDSGPAVDSGYDLVLTEVLDLGPGLLGDRAPGTRVALQAGQSCGQCATCRLRRSPCLRTRTRGVDYDGGWAQYTIAREDTLVPIPDHLPFDQAAIIPDAVSTPYAAIVATGEVRPAQAVGVWGAGGLGAHGIQLARLAGAAPIIAVDPLHSARERALAFGADLALDPADPGIAEAVLKATAGRGLDVAFDFAGVPAVREQSATVLARGGIMVLAGLIPHPYTITDGTRFSWNRSQSRGHYGSGPEYVEQLVRLASVGRLDLSPSISDHLPLHEAAEAVRRLENKVAEPIRLVLVP